MAFPIMTLAFGILPAVARDFSFMIQSAGMSAAAATIALMGVQVEMHALLWATIGGVGGIIFGLEQVRRVIPVNHVRLLQSCAAPELRADRWRVVACIILCRIPVPRVAWSAT